MLRIWEDVSYTLFGCASMIAIVALVGVAVTAYLLSTNVRRLDKRIGSTRKTPSDGDITAFSGIWDPVVRESSGWIPPITFTYSAFTRINRVVTAHVAVSPADTNSTDWSLSFDLPLNASLASTNFAGHASAHIGNGKHVVGFVRSDTSLSEVGITVGTVEGKANFLEAILFATFSYSLEE